MDLNTLIVSVVGLAVSASFLVYGIKLTRKERRRHSKIEVVSQPVPTLIGASDDKPEPDTEKESSLKDVAKGVIAWFRKEKEE